MNRTIEDIQETIKDAAQRGKKCTVLIGAGCSVSAGIPTAPEFVEIIKQRYPRKYERAAEPKSYSLCMAQLSYDERRELISEFVNKGIINWGHIALAELLKNGFVKRVMTTNFDSIMIRACALIGSFPAVYDVAASKIFIPSKVAEKSIIYLHGQQTSFVLIDTEKENSDYHETIEKVFDDASDYVWLVVGYSGENDPVFEKLSSIPRFDNALYWIGYNEVEPGEHVKDKLLNEPKDAFLVKGFDADTFFVKLARGLDCFPPEFVRKPYTYIKGRFSSLTPYVPPKTGRFSDNIDYLEYTKSRLDIMIDMIEPIQTRWIDMMELIFENRQLEAIRILDDFGNDPKYGGDIHPQISFAGYWAYYSLANKVRNDAIGLLGEESDRKFTEAIGHYKSAIEIYSNKYEAYYDCGYTSLKWAMKKHGEGRASLLIDAIGMFEEGWKLYSENPLLCLDWGTALHEIALLKEGKEAENYFLDALKKFEMSWELRKDALDILYQWGVTLHDFGLLKKNKGESAKEIFRQACDKFMVIEIKEKNNYYVYRYWGDLMLFRAQEEEDNKIALDFLELVEEKFKSAEKIFNGDPDLYGNWGTSLLERAKRNNKESTIKLLRAAEEQINVSLKIQPYSGKTLANLGLCYFLLWGLVPPEEREETVKNALGALHTAEKLSEGSSALTLAGLYAWLGHEHESKQWIRIAIKTKQIPLKEIKIKYPDFDGTNSEKWVEVLYNDLPKGKNNGPNSDR